jgi:hypothetical protein
MHIRKPPDDTVSFSLDNVILFLRDTAQQGTREPKSLVFDASLRAVASS